MSSSSLPFIEWNEGTQEFSVGKDAITVLQRLKRKLAVVVVAGKYRTGKSFLMNQIVGGNGFAVGHTVQSHTKGIWLASKPLVGHTSDGEEIDVLVMDSEGLGATDQNEKHDTIIFSLAVLFCSTLVYNGTRTINEEAISSLGFISKLASNIRVKSAPIGDERSELAQIFPSFVWVLRDFSLDLVDENGDPIDENEYMESCLTDIEGFSSDIRERNKIRRELRNFFPHRECVTLVRPTVEEDDLQHLDTLPKSKLRPEFLENIRTLSNILYEKARPKEMNGAFINGPMLIELAKSYVEAVNSGGVPVVNDAWKAAADAECESSMQSAFVEFEAKMDRLTLQFPVTEVNFNESYESFRSECLFAFQSGIPAGSSATSEFRFNLEKKMKKLYSSLMEVNVERARARCSEFMDELYTIHVSPVLGELVFSLSDEFHGSDQYFSKIKELEAQLRAPLSESNEFDIFNDSGAAASASAGMGTHESNTRLWSECFELLSHITTHLLKGPAPRPLSSFQETVFSAFSAFSRAFCDAPEALLPRVGGPAAQKYLELLHSALTSVSRNYEVSADERTQLLHASLRLCADVGLRLRAPEASVPLSELTAARTRLNLVEAELVGLRAEFAVAHAGLGDAQQRANELIGDLERAGEQQQQLTQRVEELTSSKSLLQEKLEAAELKLLETRMEVDSLGMELEESTSANKALQSQLDELSRKMQQVEGEDKDEKLKLDAEVRVAKEELQNAQKDRLALKKRLTEVETQLGLEKESVERLSQQNVALTMEIQSVKGVLLDSSSSAVPKRKDADSTSDVPDSHPPGTSDKEKEKEKDKGKDKEKEKKKETHGIFGWGRHKSRSISEISDEHAVTEGAAGASVSGSVSNLGQLIEEERTRARMAVEAAESDAAAERLRAESLMASIQAQEASIASYESQLQELQESAAARALQLEAELAQAHSTIGSLQGDLDAARNDLEMAREDLADSKEQLQLLREGGDPQVPVLNSQLTELKAQLDVLRTESRQAEDALLEAVGLKDAAERRAQALQIDLDEAAAALSESQAKIAGFQSELNIVRASLAEMELQLQQQSEEQSEEALVRLQAEIARLETALKAVESNNAELEVQHETALKQAAAALKEVETRNTELKAQLEAAASAVEAAALHESVARTLQARVDNLEIDLAASSSMCEEFESDLAAESARLQQALQRVSELEADSQRLQSALAATSAGAAVSASLADQASKVGAEAVVLRGELELARARLAATEPELERLRTEALGFGTREAEFAEAQEELLELRARLSKLQAQHDALDDEARGLHELVAASGGQLTALQAQVAQQAAAIEVFQKGAEEKATIETRLRIELQATQSMLEEQSRRAAALEAEFQYASQELHATRERLAAVEADLEFRVQNFEQLARDAEVRENNYKEMLRKNSRTSASKEGLRAANESYERKTESLLTDLQNARKETASARAEAEELRQSLEQQQEEVARWQKLGSHAEAEKVVLQESVVKLTHALAQAENDLARTNDSLSARTDELEKCRTELAEQRSLKQSLERTTRSLTQELEAKGLELARVAEALDNSSAELAELRRMRQQEAAAAAHVRTELAVFAERARRSMQSQQAELQKANATVAALRAAIKAHEDTDALLRLRALRRGRVDAAVTLLRRGMVVTKFKASSKRVEGETRMFALLPLLALSPIPSGVSATDEGSPYVEALAWGELRAKVWAKAVRVADISAVVFGPFSPTFRRFRAENAGPGAAGMRLRSACCCSVVIRPGTVLLGSGASRAPVGPEGAAVDIEFSNATDCLSFVAALRALSAPLNSPATSGKPVPSAPSKLQSPSSAVQEDPDTFLARSNRMYTIPFGWLKVDRAGVRALELAAEQGISARRVVDKLRDEARKLLNLPVWASSKSEGNGNIIKGTDAISGRANKGGFSAEPTGIKARAVSAKKAPRSTVAVRSNTKKFSFNDSESESGSENDLPMKSPVSTVVTKPVPQISKGNDSDSDGPALAKSAVAPNASKAKPRTLSSSDDDSDSQVGLPQSAAAAAVVVKESARSQMDRLIAGASASAAAAPKKSLWGGREAEEAHDSQAIRRKIGAIHSSQLQGGSAYYNDSDPTTFRVESSAAGVGLDSEAEKALGFGLDSDEEEEALRREGFAPRGKKLSTLDAILGSDFDDSDNDEESRERMKAAEQRARRLLELQGEEVEEDDPSFGTKKNASRSNTNSTLKVTPTASSTKSSGMTAMRESLFAGRTEGAEYRKPGTYADSKNPDIVKKDANSLDSKINNTSKSTSKSAISATPKSSSVPLNKAPVSKKNDSDSDSDTPAFAVKSSVAVASTTPKSSGVTPKSTAPLSTEATSNLSVRAAPAPDIAPLSIVSPTTVTASGRSGARASKGNPFDEGTTPINTNQKSPKKYVVYSDDDNVDEVEVVSQKEIVKNNSEISGRSSTNPFDEIRTVHSKRSVSSNPFDPDFDSGPKIPMAVPGTPVQASGVNPGVVAGRRPNVSSNAPAGSGNPFSVPVVSHSPSNPFDEVPLAGSGDASSKGNISPTKTTSQVDSKKKKKRYDSDSDDAPVIVLRRPQATSADLQGLQTPSRAPPAATSLDSSFNSVGVDLTDKSNSLSNLLHTPAPLASSSILMDTPAAPAAADAAVPPLVPRESASNAVNKEKEEKKRKGLFASISSAVHKVPLPHLPEHHSSSAAAPPAAAAAAGRSKQQPDSDSESGHVKASSSSGIPLGVSTRTRGRLAKKYDNQDATANSSSINSQNIASGSEESVKLHFMDDLEDSNSAKVPNPAVLDLPPVPSPAQNTVSDNAAVGAEKKKKGRYDDSDSDSPVVQVAAKKIDTNATFSHAAGSKEKHAKRRSFDVDVENDVYGDNDQEEVRVKKSTKSRYNDDDDDDDGEDIVMKPKLSSKPPKSQSRSRYNDDEEDEEIGKKENTRKNPFGSLPLSLPPRSELNSGSDADSDEDSDSRYGSSNDRHLGMFRNGSTPIPNAAGGIQVESLSRVASRNASQARHGRRRSSFISSSEEEEEEDDLGFLKKSVALSKADSSGLVNSKDKNTEKEKDSDKAKLPSTVSKKAVPIIDINSAEYQRKRLIEMSSAVVTNMQVSSRKSNKDPFAYDSEEESPRRNAFVAPTGVSARDALFMTTTGEVKGRQTPLSTSSSRNKSSHSITNNASKDTTKSKPKYGTDNSDDDDDEEDDTANRNALFSRSSVKPTAKSKPSSKKKYDSDSD